MKMQQSITKPYLTRIKTTVINIAISIILVFIKGLAGYLGHSYALIADATETGADIFSSALLWVGLKIALKSPDEEHPYGHGKAEPLAAVLISFFLIVAALFIAFNSYRFITT